MPNELIYQSEFSGQQMDERFRAVATLAEALTVLEQAIAAKYTKPDGGIPSSDMDTAVQYALALALTSVQSLADYYNKTQVDSIAAAIAATVNATSGEVVASLPTASADTLGKIYYVGPTSGEYDRYVTSYDGTTYSWLPIGTTDVNMGQYATVEQFNQLDQKMVKNEAQQLSITQRQTARKNIQVDDAIYGCRRNYTRNARTYNGNTLYLEGCNVTDLIPAKPDDVLVWRFGGTGSSNIRLEVFKADKTYIDGWSSNGYTDTRTVTVPAGETAYIRVAFSNSFANGEPVISPVSINGNDVILSAETDGYTDFVKNGSQEDDLRWKPLPLGGLLNCNTDSSGHLSPNPSYDSIRVTTKSAVTVPFPGCRLRARITDKLNYILGFYIWPGNSYGTFANSIGWFFDKSEFILPASALTIRPVIAGRTTNATGWSVPITASDIQTLIDNGDFAIEYYDDSSEGVVDRNEATRINLAALRRQQIVSPAADNGMDSMPVFSHITDIHGDALRWRNFLQYCDKVGVDFALETGDACLLQKRDSSEFIYDFANQHDTEILACIGNHEALPTGSTSLFADNLAALATKYAYLASSGTPAAKCYYYKDYDAKKIRVIVLNQYEDGVYARRIGQAQVDWFIATLLSTPAGYGVVVAYHGPEDKVVADSPYDVFRQPAPNTGSSFEPSGGFVGDRPIEKLVDAFISRGSVNFTYDDHSATYNGDSDTTMQTVSVVADFSEVDASTEFICYVCGHRHEDWIGYYDHATNKQLCLCITTGNALYGDSSNPAWSNQSDLPRGGVGVSQDAFCVYAIDRKNGNVKVMRVGATVTQKMIKREMMVIPYKD